MKIKYLLICYPLLLSSMMMAMKAYDTFGIGVNVPNALQSATFYNNKIYYGADFLHMSVNFSTEVETDYNLGTGLSDVSDISDGKLSINMLMPRLGLRLPHRKIGAMQNYNQIEGYLIIPMLKSTGDLKLEGDLHDDITDALSLMGFKVSHSVEYNFTEQFSLVADVGFNWIFWDYSTDYTEETSSYTERSQTELNTNLGMTYTKLSLHFKFKNPKPKNFTPEEYR